MVNHTPIFLVFGGDPIRHKLPRQRSLQQDFYRDVPGPAPSHEVGGYSQGGRSRPPMVRTASEGGEEFGPAGTTQYSNISVPGTNKLFL